MANGDDELTPLQKARQRLEAAGNGKQENGEQQQGDPFPDSVDTPFASAYRRLQAAGEDLPRMSEQETVFNKQQEQRMSAYQKLLETRREAPEQLDEELSGEGEGDPGIAPGDQEVPGEPIQPRDEEGKLKPWAIRGKIFQGEEITQEQRERLEQSKPTAMDQAVKNGITTVLALQPGTEENIRTREAISQGFQRQIEKIRRSRSLTKLMRAGDANENLSMVTGAPAIEEATTSLSPEERMKAARRFAESTERLRELGQPEAVTRAARSGGFFSALRELGEEPTVAVPSLVASSSLSSVPPAAGAIVGSAAGPAGSAVGQFLGTMFVERQLEMANLMAEEGVDLSDPNDVLAATADPEMRRRIKNRATRRGLGVGLVDGLFGAATAGMARMAVSPITKMVGGYVTETAGEVAGEGAGQLFAGQEINRAEMAMEGVAGLAQSGVTSVGTIAMQNLQPSEKTLADEIRRQARERTATLEVPESKVAQLLQRAVDNGGLEQPRSAAERTINQAIRDGTIQVEPPPTREAPEDLPEPAPEPTEEAEPTGEARPEVLDRIASKVRQGEPLSDQEEAVRRTNVEAVEERLRAEQTETRAQREPSTPRQRVEALGLDPATTPTNLEDVADLETTARALEDLNSAELESQIETIDERLERFTTPPEEREQEPTGDPQKLAAVRQLANQERTQREAQETGEREPTAEEETEAAPEPGEERSQFIRDVAQAPPELLQAAAANPEIAEGEADVIRTEVEQRRQDNAIQEQEAETVLSALPQRTGEGGGQEQVSGQRDDQAVSRGGEEREGGQRRVGPDIQEVEEGVSFVDVGGTEPADVEIMGEPSARTVPVRKTTPTGETIETISLLQNLRREEEVSGDQLQGSSFPTAEVGGDGSAVLTDEFQVVPEGATIPPDADVRFDMGTADLPVARRDPETARQEEAEQEEDLSQMGRRTPIEQEERIEQQVEQTERELDQARKALKDLKRQRPEQERAEGEQESIFPTQQQQEQAEQAALGQEFEQSPETTEALQEMIDEQRSVVEQLQQRLIDLRKRAPDAQAEARRSQTDIEQEIEQQTETREDGTQVAPPRTAANIATTRGANMGTQANRQVRSAAIQEDLRSVLQDAWRGTPRIEERIEDVSRAVDHVRELRGAAQRGVITDRNLERDVASLRSHVDNLIGEMQDDLAPQEMTALRRRVQEWTETTGDPGSPAQAHLNAIGGNEVGPQWENADGYQVRTNDAGQLEIISPNTGEAIDRRSSRYDDVLLDYLEENSEQIDERPRVTDTNPSISFGEWSSVVASASKNPFEIVEAIIVEQSQENFDPVTLGLQEAGRLSTTSLDPYISSDEIVEMGAGNWVTSEGGTAIENAAKRISQTFGVDISPQEIVDNYILEFPGGPNTISSTNVRPLLDQFESVTGLSIDVQLAQRIHDRLYQSPTSQQHEEQGTEAPFDPVAPYIHRSAERRSNTYERDGQRYVRRDDPRSLRELAEDGYELREGEPESVREDGLRAMDQLSLFGPPDGERQGERDMRGEPEQGPTPEEEVSPEDLPDIPGATTSQRRRIQEGLLARGITDDLAVEKGASLVGRQVTGPEDLAALAQVLRDPRFETFRIFFVQDQEGGQEIVHHTAVSSRMPGTTRPFPLEIEHMEHIPDELEPANLRTGQRLSYWVLHQMDQLGADGYYLMHNHPSGQTKSSRGDRRMTKIWAIENPGFRGHVIIDSGQFRVINTDTAQMSEEEARAEFRRRTKDLSATEPSAQREVKRTRERMIGRFDLTERDVEITDPETLERARIETRPRSLTDLRQGTEVQIDQLLTASMDHPALTEKVTGDQALARVMRTVSEDTDAPVIVYRAANGFVRGLVEINSEFIQRQITSEVGRQVLAGARHVGGTEAFLVNVSEDLLEKTKRLTDRGVFMDFVTQGGKSGTDYGLQVGGNTRQFGLPDSDISPVRVEEDQETYGSDLRDEIRRRVGELQHNAENQQDPAPDSGPVDNEYIRQAAVRIGGELYRGTIHPEAIQAAINDGAARREGGQVVLEDGTPLAQAVADGDANVDLFTTNQGRVVARQETGHVIGVGRADQVRTPQRTERLAPPPDPLRVAEQLSRLEARGAKILASDNLPENANNVDYSLEMRTPLQDALSEARRSLTDKTVNSGNPVSAPDVIQKYIDVVRAAGRSVPVRYGRSRAFSFGTAGVFKVQPEVIRLKEANDIPVAAHEMGHALEKAVFGWVDGSPWQEGVAGTEGAVQDELTELGEELYGDRTPNGGYKREGWAEFIKLYLIDEQRAQENAPNLHEWFTSEWLPGHPEIASAMEDAQAMSSRWYDQGAMKRARASVQMDRSFFEDFKETISTPEGRQRLITEASQATLTEFSPLLRLVEEAEQRMGEELPIEENPFLTAEALQKTHTARTRMFVEQGTFDFAGNPVGPPLRDAAQLVEGQREEFTLYLWARRALKLWEGQEAKFDDDGVKIQSEKPPRNPGISKEDAQYIFDYYDSETFREAAERVYQWNDEVLDYTKAAFDPNMAERVKGGDVGDYVPLQRVFGDLNEQVVEARQAAGGGRVLGSDPIQSLEGSPRRIRDPFQAMIEQAEGMIRATHERYLLNQLINIGQNVEGMGRFVEQVPRDQVPTRINTERVVQDLRDEGLVIDIPQRELNRRIEQIAEQWEDGRRPDIQSEQEIAEVAREELMEEKLGGFLTFFKPAIVPEGSRDPIVAVQQEDGVQWFELSRELYDTFSGLDIYRLPWLLDKTFGATARSLRMGTTGLRASFALITNPARDIQTLYAQSRSAQNPGSMFMGWFRSMRAGIESVIRDDIDVDPMFQRFMRLGGEMARPLGVDTQETQRAVRELFQGRAMRLFSSPASIVDHLRDVFQIPESATRVAEMKARADEIGYEEGTRMSEGQALQLLLDAKRVTTDFTSQGKYTKAWNQIVPFTTATIGGQRAFVRAFKQNPKRAIAAALTFTTMTLAYWWEIKDEEWYKDMIPRHKFNKWYFPIGEDGPVLVIPRPFEWGATFSATPEALADAWYQKEPRRVEEMFGHLYEHWSPLGTTNFGGTKLPFTMPVPLEVGAEQLYNQEFYFETPIVPRGEEDKPLVEQFGPYTSTVAVTVGEIFGASPRRIDHIIAGIFGGVGRDATQSLDSLISVLGLEEEIESAVGAEFKAPAVEREQTAADIPVAGRLFRRGGKPGTQSQAVDDFYEMLQERQTIQASDRQDETLEQRQERLLLQDGQKALSLLFWLRRHTRESELSQNLQREIRSLAQEVVRTVESGDVEGVMRQRGTLKPLKRLERQTEELGPETIRPILESLTEQQIAPSENGEEQ